MTTLFQLSSNAQQILTGFLECMDWAEQPEDPAERWESHSPELLSQSSAIVQVFCHDLDLNEADLSSSPLGQIGHDLWLTICGHGCGFWEGDHPEYDEKAMDAWCKTNLPNFDSPYAGDDGLAYFCDDRGMVERAKSL